MTLSQRNKNLVVGTMNAALAGEMDDFLTALHPDVQVHEPGYLPYGGDYHGHDAFLRVAEAGAKLLNLSELTLISATADENRTVLLMTIPLVGSDEIVHVTEHWTVVDNLITDVRVFWFEGPVFEK